MKSNPASCSSLQLKLDLKACHIQRVSEVSVDQDVLCFNARNSQLYGILDSESIQGSSELKLSKTLQKAVWTGRLGFNEQLIQNIRWDDFAGLNPPDFSKKKLTVGTAAKNSSLVPECNSQSLQPVIQKDEQKSTFNFSNEHMVQPNIVKREQCSSSYTNNEQQADQSCQQYSKQYGLTFKDEVDEFPKVVTRKRSYTQRPNRKLWTPQLYCQHCKNPCFSEAQQAKWLRCAGCSSVTHFHCEAIVTQNSAQGEYNFPQLCSHCTQRSSQPLPSLQFRVGSDASQNSECQRQTSDDDQLNNVYNSQYCKRVKASKSDRQTHSQRSSVTQDASTCHSIATTTTNYMTSSKNTIFNVSDADNYDQHAEGSGASSHQVDSFADIAQDNSLSSVQISMEEKCSIAKEQQTSSFFAGSTAGQLCQKSYDDNKLSQPPKLPASTHLYKQQDSNTYIPLAPCPGSANSSLTDACVRQFRGEALSQIFTMEKPCQKVETPPSSSAIVPDLINLDNCIEQTRVHSANLQLESRLSPVCASQVQYCSDDGSDSTHNLCVSNQKDHKGTDLDQTSTLDTGDTISNSKNTVVGKRKNQDDAEIAAELQRQINGLRSRGASRSTRAKPNTFATKIGPT